MLAALTENNGSDEDFCSLVRRTKLFSDDVAYNTLVIRATGQRYLDGTFGTEGTEHLPERKGLPHFCYEHNE